MLPLHKNFQASMTTSDRIHMQNTWHFNQLSYIFFIYKPDYNIRKK